MSVKEFVKAGGLWLKRNKSTILLYTQAVSVPAIAVTAACAVPAYEQERQNKIEELKDDLTWEEEAKIFAKHFWKTGVAIVGTEVAIFVKDSWDKKDIAALAALAVSQENRLKEFKDAVVKTVGDKKAEEIQQTYANSHERPDSDLNDILNAKMAMKGSPLIWQDLRFDTGYFLATYEHVDSTCKYYIKRVASGDTVTAFEFKDALGSKTNRESECCGFERLTASNEDGIPNFKYDGVKKLSDGTIIHLLDYDISWVDKEYLVESEYD